MSSRDLLRTTCAVDERWGHRAWRRYPAHRPPPQRHPYHRLPCFLGRDRWCYPQQNHPPRHHPRHRQRYHRHQLSHHHLSFHSRRPSSRKKQQYEVSKETTVWGFKPWQLCSSYYMRSKPYGCYRVNRPVCR